MEPAVAVRTIGGMLLGFLMLKIMEGEASPINNLPPEKVAENIADFVLHGLLNESVKNKNGKGRCLMINTAIAVNNLTFKYGKLKVVDDMSMQIQPGTSYGLLGPNGAGKTT